jgi:hypothetical protein
MQPLPTAITFNNMSGTMAIENSLVLVGSTVTINAQLYKYSNGSITPMSDTICTFSPSFTGILTVGDTASCSITGMSASYAAGDAGFVVVSATAAGLSLENTVTLDVSIGVSP